MTVTAPVAAKLAAGMGAPEGATNRVEFLEISDAAPGPSQLIVYELAWLL